MTFIKDISNPNDMRDVIENLTKRRKIMFPEMSFTLDTNEEADNEYISSRMHTEYNAVKELPSHLVSKMTKSGNGSFQKTITEGSSNNPQKQKLLEGPNSEINISNELIKTDSSNQRDFLGMNSDGPGTLVHRFQRDVLEKPQWHAPWKLMRVIAGHSGWVRSVCVEPNNKWFATGAADRTIKIWDLASGMLKLTLTGHIMTVRGLVVSSRHPYLFSGGEDKTLKCWDLEMNKVVRDYHGHLSSIYSVDLHPTLDLVVSAGRDAVVRVWDMRTRVPVFTLTGHKSQISQVKCQDVDPQIISTSMDKTVRLWDLVAGRSQTVLTHHKKSVRALTVHPEEFTFATGSPDNIKKWKCPEGSFIHNFYPQHNSIVNTLSSNADGVMFSGGDDGTMGFFDWKTGHKFQATETTTIPGSLSSENGIFASSFDRTGLRLITCEADKSIKIWKEDPDATPTSDPGIQWNPTISHYRA